MAKKFLTPISVLNLSADPQSANEGDIYYNTSSDVLRIYANSSWTDVSSGGGASLPSQSGNSGKYLKTNGTSASWDAINLGTDTTGNYIATIAGTTNEIEVTGSGSENAAVTLSLPDTINANTTGSAASLTTARTISLGGDLSGSASFNGTSNITITAAVADDSHNHTISNVDGLQTALDAKLPSTSYTASDVLTKIKTVDGASSGLDADLLDGEEGSYYLDWTNTTNKPDPTITLGGDLSGSVTLTNLGNGTLTATVADDSHNHVISNVDGLQTALNAKAPLASPTFTGTPAAPTASAATNTTQIATTAFVQTAVSNLVDSAPGTLDTLNELAAALGDDPNFATTVTNSIAGKQPLDADLTAIAGLSGTSGFLKKTAANTWSLDTNSYLTGNQTITLSGDVSGSGTTAITVTVNDDSHNHVISNVDGLQTALDAKLDSSSYTASDVLTKIKTVDGASSGLDADLLDGQHGSYYLDWTNVTNKPDPTITLGGDASGSLTLTNLAGGTLTVTVADDSHNHVISNIDGLQTALDAKAADNAVVHLAGTETITGAKTFSSNATFSSTITTNGTKTRDKLRVWTNGTYAIGMDDPYTFGAINNDYAMTFQMSNSSGRGFWWGDSSHTNAQGAMSLSTQGKLTVADSIRVGFGESDTTIPGATHALEVNGSLAATSKSFVIDHPTKPDMKLRYGSLEGPENGVYVRGKSKSSTITLPDYWTGLVDEDSITVQLTPIGKHKNLYVKDISNNTVTIGGYRGDFEFFYFIQAERKDIDKLVVEYGS